MNVIVPPKVFTEGEISKALEREIRTGFQLERERENARVALAKKRADQMKGGREIPGLGRCISVLPSRDFFRLIQKYGHQEFNSDEFQRYMHKKIPSTKVASV